jgi:hypothetical protein
MECMRVAMLDPNRRRFASPVEDAKASPALPGENPPATCGSGSAIFGSPNTNTRPFRKGAENVTVWGRVGPDVTKLEESEKGLGTQILWAVGPLREFPGADL